MLNSLLELSRNMRIADLFDIGILSFVAYSAIVWFLRTTSRLVVIGMVVLALVYFAARTFDLYLTSLLFQAFFAVFVVAMVVVFQEEIRRGFERIAIWGTFRDRRRLAAMPGVDTLLEGISTMMSERVGALIVVRGREPLDRHVEGGIPLYGRISKPLLYSLFDPHSAGHDGAALIEGDRISKFGVHLPLSKNMAEIGTLGTRHAAGLGLSECSDAFIIIVSEERGTLCVAQNGRLAAIHSVSELKSRLERFYADHFQQETKSHWKGVFRQNARIKIISVGLAVTAWFLFAYRADNIQRTFVVPIEHRNIPAGWSVESREPREAAVTLNGSSRAFQLLNPSSLMLSLDLARIQEGEQAVAIGENQLRKPANLKIYRIDPATLTLWAYPMAMADLPVEAQTKNALPKGLQLGGLKVIPERVRVKMRRRRSERIQTLWTEPIDLSEVTRTTLLPVGLLLPDGVRMAEGTPPSVQVTVEVAGQAPSAS